MERGLRTAMPILFDYDNETGLKTTFDYDPIKDQVTFSYSQDVSAFLDRMKEKRDNSYGDTKEEWWHYASIPQIVEIELAKKGLSLYDKNHTKAILKEINQNYPYLKATEKIHR